MVNVDIVAAGVATGQVDKGIAAVGGAEKVDRAHENVVWIIGVDRQSPGHTNSGPNPQNSPSSRRHQPAVPRSRRHQWYARRRARPAVVMLATSA